VRDQDGPVLAAPRKDDKPLFTTAAYEKQLNDANALIDKVIRENLPGTRHG
jgi:membrane fusion protein, multidrug efflux system